MITISSITVACVPADIGKISLKQMYLSQEKQSDCILKLYFKTLDKIYGKILTKNVLFSK